MDQVADDPRHRAIPRDALSETRGEPGLLPSLAAIVAAAALLIWPAILNGYPILFVDTIAYLLHTITGEAPWDKTAAYGPFLWVFHQGCSLWLPVIAQGVILSHLLWLVQRVACGRVSPMRHLLLCAAMAALTAAPWFVATLMPDYFTPITVLGLYLLGFGEQRLSRAETFGVGLLTTLAIAVHLSHLPVALAVLVLILLVRRQWRPVLRGALPMLAAILFLLGANWQAFGRAVLSPHGSVFLLARLQEDGTALRTLRDRCPESGWYLCDFMDAMPMDSDRFLWNPDGPAARDAAGNDRPMGSVMLAPEAAEVVAATLRAYPLEVVRDSLANGAKQLFMTRLGDTFAMADLDEFAARVLRPGFPGHERRAFEASAQMHGAFEMLPHVWMHQPVLVLGSLMILAGWWRLARFRPQDMPRLGLVLCVLVGVGGNALATGALSKPHHRYQARIGWLLPLGALLAFWPATVVLPTLRRPEWMPVRWQPA